MLKYFQILPEVALFFSRSSRGISTATIPFWSTERASQELCVEHTVSNAEGPCLLDILN